MEKVKRKRTLLRSAFTRALNSINTAVDDETVSIADIRVSMQLLDEKYTALQKEDANVFDKLIETAASDDEIETESISVDEYKTKYIKMQHRVFYKTDGGQSEDQRAATSSSSYGKRQTLKLPKIELKKFNGDIKEWLQFWSQFRKIHEDGNTMEEDKFQYLIQAMVPSSRAYELVTSFPPTRENYTKVIASLKNRFGRDELLVEVYVRELLKLVLQNAMKQCEKLPLASLYDKIESHLRALETLNVTTDKCAAMLFPLVESCLPEELLRAWQRSTAGGDGTVSKDRLDALIKFLQSEVENEQRISMAVSGFELKTEEKKFPRFKNRADFKRDVPTAAGLISMKINRDLRCIFCSGNHDSVECEKARKMDLNERRKIAREKNCCFSCLKIGHRCKDCRVKVKCAWCGKRHVVLMCPSVTSDKEVTLMKNKDESEVLNESNLASFSHHSTVLLQTLRVKLRNDTSCSVVRAIIDTGSQKSYILKEAANTMGYKPIGEQLIAHSLFGGVKSEPQNHECYTVRLASLDGKYRCNFQALDQEVICGTIPSVKNGPWMRELNNLNVKLTDASNDNEPIKVLIGADIAGKLLTGRQHILKSGLVAVETRLGWTLMGKMPREGVRDDTALVVTSMFVKEAKISDLWTLDVLGINDPVERKMQKEREKEVHDMFLQTVRVNRENRYEVQLPWIENHPSLPTNEEIARRRLETTTRKLRADHLFEEYDAVLSEWRKEGIVELVPDEEVHHWGHYLPHRHVVKQNSTTKLRPVFDASARSKDTPSLNQCLETGPNLIELISTILLRFRRDKIGVVSDIRKAFLQISLCKNDRDYLRFFWYDKNGKIIVLRHTRVVFGVSCSPFLLGAVIDLHLRKKLEQLSISENYSRDVVQKLIQSFYVDNCVTSVSSEEELRRFVLDATTVMADGAFDLRGWEFSDEEGGEVRIPVLGIIWDKVGDTLQVNVAPTSVPLSEKVTKRFILSVAHSIFDPIGYLSPVLLCPKVLLQETWSEKIEWDDEVKEDLKRRFLKWFRELERIKEIKIPRCLFLTTKNNEKVSFHVFCDASKIAYAAVMFVRVEGLDRVNVQLVQAKCRVASTKKMTIPRMELLAATIGARLANSTLEALGYKDVPVYYWTDSTTVLSWIQRSAQWATFVWNRVQEIRQLTDPKNWKHVPGELNPADLPSRGCSVGQLIVSKWWEGPEWLQNRSEEWPMEEFHYDENEINCELKKSVLSVSVCSNHNQPNSNKNVNDVPVLPWYAKRFSSYSKIIRLVSWIKRFINNCRNPSECRNTGELTVPERIDAENLILKFIQQESFVDVKNDKIKSLYGFMADDGLIRIKSKLIQRDDSYGFRFPIVLPARHPVIVLLIRERHEELLHAGLQVLMNNLRENYWMLGGRKTIRQVIKRCVICRRYESQPLRSDPVSLPLNRVRDAAVFEVTGVDFAGPVFLKGDQKAWICLFTCAVYRAVHLELVTSLSTEAFLEALRRFIARRGRPNIMYSDNGRNFVGANNLFKLIDWSKLTKISALQMIKWEFIPPNAPWWGGWWERLIGLLKRLLRRVLGRSRLTYEEMMTILCDCEAVINSRPITYLSDGKQEFVPLSPSMFLQDIREIGVPDCDNIERHKLKGRFLYRQKIKDDLRCRFRSEYLGELRHHVNCHKEDRKVQVGDIVLIGDDHTKRLDWPIARVKHVNGRVIRLTTSTGELTRPVQRIYPLELISKTIDNNIEPIQGNDFVDVQPHTSDIKERENRPCKENYVVTRSGRVSKKPNRLGF